MSGNVAQPKATSTAATLLGIGAVLLWCSTGVCYRAGAVAIGPMAYLALIAATGAATVVLLRIAQRKPLAWLIRLPGRVVVAGCFGIAVYSILLVEAFGTADERDFGQVNLLNYLWPIWVVVLSFRLLPEKTRLAPALAGAALGFVGIFIAGGPGSLAHPPSNILPHVMAAAGGFLWALYSVLLRRWEEPPERSGVPLYFAACAALAAAVAAIRGEWAALNWAEGNTAFWVLLGGVGPTGLAYYWWEIAMKRGNARLVVSLGFAIPIVSSVLIGLSFGQAMNIGLLPGAVLIAVGAYLAWRATTERTN
jgi:drug/metabolite transporter (DMT)-like permease